MDEIVETLHWVVIAASTYGGLAPETVMAQRKHLAVVRLAVLKAAAEAALTTMDLSDRWAEFGGEG